MKVQERFLELTVKLATLFLITISTGLFSGVAAAADELIISEATYEQLLAGDFTCGACRHPVTNAIPFTQMNSNCCEIKAGDLYRFFKDQGIDSINELVFCLDVPSVQNDSTVAFSSIKFMIEGYKNSEVFDTGEKTIVLPGYESSGLKPEARLKLNLGFDFMQQFTESSTETIKLDYNFSSQESAVPTFFLEGDRPWTPNVLIVSLFVGGSILLLTVLYFMTKPSGEKKTAPVKSVVNPNAIAT